MAEKKGGVVSLGAMLGLVEYAQSGEVLADAALARGFEEVAVGYAIYLGGGGEVQNGY